MQKVIYPEFDIFNLSSFEVKICKYCDHRDINMINKRILRQTFFDFSHATQEEFCYRAF